MTVEHGFELIQEEIVSEINSTTRLYKHVKSGAELLSVINDDENKVFGITFRTPPSTSNGIAHIMEHCVLCGSVKYPVKEPFIEMIKGSLKTYLNAVTYPDRTSYPVASTNTKDLYNLIDVYLDAVFHPLLTKHNMEQEGWHYELESVEEPLVYKGVVFNEMKGAYSSPEGNLGRRQQQAVFDPSHTYGVDSGGDPQVIPELTYEEFQAFHQKYYHPSNARIYFYGDDDPSDRLAYLNKILSDFDAIEVDSNIDPYPLREETRRYVFPYAVDSDDPSQNKNYFTLNWLLPEVTDSATQMGLSILSRVLSGSPGAPLRRILTESGLGEDTLGGGFASYLRQPLFSAGMKGISKENLEAVEALILETLATLAADGIDPEEVTSA
ncbi:MAG: insulinase family protein, partial [Chloroflexota bacterium]